MLSYDTSKCFRAKVKPLSKNTIFVNRTMFRQKAASRIFITIRTYSQRFKEKFGKSGKSRIFANKQLLDFERLIALIQTSATNWHISVVLLYGIYDN